MKGFRVSTQRQPSDFFCFEWKGDVAGMPERKIGATEASGGKFANDCMLRCHGILCKGAESWKFQQFRLSCKVLVYGNRLIFRYLSN